ncbi:MAG: Exostosin family protein [Candidatus Accumulibacter appositus]|uniref:Exostosin family protein n=1 Tax=Candidatus Accumulibacter appositus TaxID=1454003 RepID=A0A011PZT1_9PROT|nr:exostosin family protein [Accumulibacter sp.]EXI82420.1 MAG: Exostosin family protein [Candidatus Accumulibacter appositus]HRF02977.1 exostosin family protein [Accumulibacter sp.]
MMVFIVTPSFNAVSTIDRTIHSVISQSGDFSLRYHVQDGGSSDGTIETLKRWAYLIKQGLLPLSCHSVEFSWESCPDGGMYDAIAKAIKAFSCGADDWLTWINADDVLLPTALPLLYKIDADPVLSGKVHWVTGAAATCRDGCQNTYVDRVLCSEVVAKGLADGTHWSYVQQEGTFFRAGAWNLVGEGNAFARMRFAGDWNLWRLLAKHYSLYQFDYPTGMFSSRPGQLSQSGKDIYDQEMSSVAAKAGRPNSLRELEGRDLRAFYLQCKNDVLSLAEKPIKGHLAYRLQRISQLVGAEQNSAIQNVKSEPVLKPPLEGTDKTRMDAPKPSRYRSIVSYDSEWQFPAITEQHAFCSAKRLLPAVGGVVYFAFPWATLIDLLNSKKEDSKRLQDVLREAGVLLRPGERVVTVCQHIHMLRYQNIFAELGIHEVFWTHAVKNQSVFPEYPKIRIFPFPLYPVQAVGEDVDFNRTRSILYSFVGAKANKWYLTSSRNYILDLLSGDKRGLVIGRDTWHYNRVVYDHQIHKKATGEGELVDSVASNEFKTLLRDSIFSLCPSGSGPNSIRLWESIGCGTIPVILADTYLPPGDSALWEEAAVFCLETENAIKALPQKLEELAEDKEALARKQRALKQLWLLYGPDCFIYDIQKLFLELAEHSALDRNSAPVISFARLVEEAQRINDCAEVYPYEFGTFILGCGTRVMTDPGGFKDLYSSNLAFRKALAVAIERGDEKHRKLMSDVLRLKKVTLGEKVGV